MFKLLGGLDNPKAVPEALQYLEAEVLRANTPVELCRLAAGEHQLEQRDVLSISVADSFAFFVKSAREKASKLKTAFFTDAEVAQMGCQLSLQQYLDRNGNIVTEEKAVCFKLTCNNVLRFVSFSQCNNLVQLWRPMAFWASCSWEDDLVAAKVKQANHGCAPGKEVIRPSTLKEIATLNISDFKEYNKWLLQEEKPTYKSVVNKLLALRHWRWAYWHVMAPDNPMVAESCSMSLFVGCPGIVFG